MNIEDYGFKNNYIKNENQIPARILATYKNRYQIILTKNDLVDNPQEYINEVESVAIGVDIYSVSCKTGDGLDSIKKYFKKGNTIVFLGSSGVGK